MIAFRYNFSKFIYGYLPAFLLGAGITTLSVTPKTLQWFIWLICLFIGFKSVTLTWIRKQSTNDFFDYIAHPLPSTQDILSMILNCAILFLTTFTATYIPANLLFAMQLSTMSNWFLGVCTFTTWMFLFEIQNSYTTHIQIKNGNALISYGPMSFTFDVRDVVSVRTTKVTLEDRLRSRLFIVGAKKNGGFTVVKLKQNGRKATFLDIYIAPSNPYAFLMCFQQKTELPNEKK